MLLMCKMFEELMEKGKVEIRAGVSYISYQAGSSLETALFSLYPTRETNIQPHHSATQNSSR